MRAFPHRGNEDYGHGFDVVDVVDVVVNVDFYIKVGCSLRYGATTGAINRGDSYEYYVQACFKHVKFMSR